MFSFVQCIDTNKRLLSERSVGTYCNDNTVIIFFSFFLKPSRIIYSMQSRIVSLFDPIYARSDDDELERIRKKCFFPCFVSGFLISTCSLFYIGRLSRITGACSVLGIISNAYMLISIYLRKRLTERDVEVYCAFTTVTLLGMDLASAAAPQVERVWPIFIVVIDVLLLTRAKESTSRLLVGILVFWCIINSSERMFRFGLYDIPGTYTHDRRREVTDCSKPPCASVPTGLLSLSLFLVVFLIDFSVTRMFARNLLSEKAKVEASIAIAHSITNHLAEFDLETAEEALHGNSADLPPDLSASFRQLLDHLKNYRPYLPQSCLLFDARKPTNETVTIKGISLSRSVVGTIIENPLAATTQPQNHRIHLCRKNITLIVANIKNSVELLAHEATLFYKIHSHIVSIFIAAVKENVGMTDMFIGDHFFGSFNTKQRCSAHCRAAVEAALTFTRRCKLDHTVLCDVNIGIGSSKAMCGDLGSAEMKRYSIMGPVCRWTCILERLGREYGHQVILDSVVQAKGSGDPRVLLQTIKYPLHTGAFPAVLYEVHCEDHVNNFMQDIENWMYETTTVSKWLLYNEAALSYLAENYTDALSILGEADADDYLEIITLRDRATRQEPPPPILTFDM